MKRLDAFHIYTDGACSRNPGPAGWACLIRRLSNGDEVELSGTMPDDDTTNQQAEMMALLQALEALSKDGTRCIVAIYTDSTYVQGCITKNWKRKANLELWSRLDAALAGHEVAFIEHVKAHSGHPENTRVDKLAREAMHAAVAQNFADDLQPKLWARNPRSSAKPVETVAA